jgi:1-acyl-sn-glycerol-3-phosphate acyltransferase
MRCKKGIFSWLNSIFFIPLFNFLLIKEVKGLENVPEGNFILASNHQSYLDIFIDGGLCVPRRFHFIGRVDSWKGIAGFFIKLYYLMAGVIPLNRVDEESKKTTIQKAIEVLRKGEILIIYPEGTRSKDGKLQEGKLGIAKILLKTGAPILPVGIKGTFKLMPPHGKLKIKKLVKVNIGKPLFFKEELEKAGGLNENSEEYSQLLRRITGAIMREINNLITVL